MKKKLAFALISLVFFTACRKEPSQPAAESAAPAAAVPEVRALPAEGVKQDLPGGGWFTWKFSEKPKLGTLIVKVQAFKQDGSRDTAFEVVGETGMPSMRAHDLTVGFVKNKKGDYLMPFDVVMPGEWQVVILIKLDKKEIYEGKVLFSV